MSYQSYDWSVTCYLFVLSSVFSFLLRLLNEHTVYIYTHVCNNDSVAIEIYWI
jgi:hypothetical protein